MTRACKLTPEGHIAQLCNLGKMTRSCKLTPGGHIAQLCNLSKMTRACKLTPEGHIAQLCNLGDACNLTSCSLAGTGSRTVGCKAVDEYISH